MLFLAALAGVSAEPVKMTLVPSGAVEKMGYYSPQRAMLKAEPTAKGKTFPKAQYGTLDLGGKKIPFALADLEGGKTQIVLDLNGNGTFDDDKAETWTPDARSGGSVAMGPAMVDLGKGQPVKVVMYRFNPEKATAAAQKDSLFFYPDYGYELSFQLDGKPFTSFVSGDPGPQSGISVDRNGDGQISAFRESVRMGKPFNYTGTTYTFVVKDGTVTLEPAAEKMDMMPLPPDLREGKKTIPIVATGLDGQPVDLMKDYKGKLVMLDFWATWCGPCMGELPNVKAAYDANHANGFEILGISFDDADYTADKLKSFLAEKGMTWRQLYEGKGWETKVGMDYDVSGIPFTLLVDGDTGEIVGTEKDMRGPGLKEFVAKKLAEKKAKG